MKKLLSLCLMGLLAVALALPAEAAKRFGGGQSIGKQRDSINSYQRAPAPAAPQAAPQAVPAQPQAQAPRPGGASRWLGPLAGLAVGGLLGSMFFGHGGGGFSGILMLLLGAGVIWMVFRALRGAARPAAQERYAGPAPDAGAPARFEIPAIGAGAAPPAAGGGPVAGAAPRVPPGFAVEPFLREAKVAFMRLQDDNDRRDLDDIREFTTPEMYAEIALQFQQRDATPQKVEVVKVDADLIEVVLEGERAIASVRFHGLIREDAGAAPGPFDEVWHVQKSATKAGDTWRVSGIQQF